MNSVIILSFRTDMPGQTVQTQIRLQSDQCLANRVNSVSIVWTHYSMVEPHRSNFRVITTNFLGVRIFRKFTVLSTVFANLKKRSNNVQFLWYHNIVSDIANIIPGIILVKIWKDSIKETVRIYWSQNCTPWIFE